MPPKILSIPEGLVPYALTSNFHFEGDLVGEVSALVSVTPMFLVVSYVTLMISRRDVHTFTLFIGQLCNEVLNSVLKKYIKEPRPVGFDIFVKSYGMPSNHSQFMAFIAGYFLFWSLASWKGSRLGKAVIILTTHSMCIAVMFSRVYLVYHSLSQVLAGYAIGMMFGFVWWVITEFFLRSLFPSIVSTKIAKWLLLRDCSNVDTFQVEYDAVMASTNSAEIKRKVE